MYVKSLNVYQDVYLIFINWPCHSEYWDATKFAPTQSVTSEAELKLSQTRQIILIQIRHKFF